jgi:hypothetical protein
MYYKNFPKGSSWQIWTVNAQTGNSQMQSLFLTLLIPLLVVTSSKSASAQHYVYFYPLQ